MYVSVKDCEAVSPRCQPGRPGERGSDGAPGSQFTELLITTINVTGNALTSRSVIKKWLGSNSPRGQIFYPCVNLFLFI